MKSLDSQTKFIQLRERFPLFVYQSYTFRIEKATLFLKFKFSLSDKYIFEPELEIPARSFYNWEALSPAQMDNLVFHIGMIELVSYWKLACSPTIVIQPFKLSATQIAFWEKLYYHGLGEFFYLNEIQTSQSDFVSIQSKVEKVLSKMDFPLAPKVLVPVGGGKDSVVSLELLRGQNEVIPFIINPRPASSNCALIGGFSSEQTAVVNRKLDPLLLELNEQGFLNGHTPFSALLAFVSLLVAAGAGLRYIALSNESSANEPTVPGTQINHQYSKSLDFEQDFRNYVAQYIHPEMKYFSFLRPLNELQIAKLFSQFTAYHPVFRSCNVGSKTDSWCGKCPKCLFTWIILSPFIAQPKLEGLFNKNLLADLALITILNELSGQSAVKPFECVGTISEVKAALLELLLQSKTEDLPVLLKHIQSQLQQENINDSLFKSLLSEWQSDHFLPACFTQTLKQALYD
ncbi:MAG: hypothetical protein M0Q90_05230 [Bacteroidales bacterium]|nr:hypothetical protein [Bacteroidales bacterium]